jgi:hypothetical protein
MPFSKQHIQGNIVRWRVNYTRWLEDGAIISNAITTSSSTTCIVSGATIKGPEILFFVQGGALNETLTVSVQITDNFGNVKNDQILFTVVPP